MDTSKIISELFWWPTVFCLVNYINQSINQKYIPLTGCLISFHLNYEYHCVCVDFMLRKGWYAKLKNKMCGVKSCIMYDKVVSTRLEDLHCILWSVNLTACMTLVNVNVKLSHYHTFVLSVYSRYHYHSRYHCRLHKAHLWRHIGFVTFP